jgi:TRAP-type C4-dicarboxylate transport system permease small subunit
MMELLHAFNMRMSRLLLALSGLALVVMTLVTTANVVMRLVSESIFGTIEMVGWSAVCVNALALAYSQQCREHVAITLFTDWLPERYRRGLDAAGYVTGAVFAGAAAWGLWFFIGNMIRSGQLSTSLGIIYWPFVVVLFVGILALFLVLVEDFLVAVTGGARERPQGSH